MIESLLQEERAIWGMLALAALLGGWVGWELCYAWHDEEWLGDEEGFDDAE